MHRPWHSCPLTGLVLLLLCPKPVRHQLLSKEAEVVSSASPLDFRVVGIGASAGGLESLEQFFANVPANSGMAFVVVQHLSPDFKSMMDELLSRHCDMPVKLAEHNVEVEPNHVY